jgi:bifunctional non-homologous end joining protein LigD
MSLERYWQKRDFGATPEPRGAPGGVGATPRFVVQRHRASRPHYDFRLEIEGVLMSWAIPRGPSMRPLERRMAARTEDHPLEYFDFEGLIPRGEYGAGDVIVWDWGTWEPEAETPDPAAAITAGELKLVLHGERLRGRFVLVRTRSHDPAKGDWLLIHKRDADADAAWDIDAYPTSVKSGRTNDEVKAGAAAIWDTRAPAAGAAIDMRGAIEAPLPDFIPPMLATLVDDAFDDSAWLFELKLDGYRVEAVIDGGQLRLWTRNRQDALRYFPELAALGTGWIRAQTAVVDGEVVAIDAAGRPRFSLLRDRSGSGERPAIVYQVFDLLHLDGRSTLAMPLEERKKLLRSVVRDGQQVRYLAHIETDGVAFRDAVGAQGQEGIVAKLRRAPYEPGKRSRGWLKIKIRHEQELVVGGYEPGKGSHADLGSLLVGTYEEGLLRYAGEVGSGLDAGTRRSLRATLDAAATHEPPFANPPGLPLARWCEPRLVIRAEFAEWTPDGVLRHASFKGIEPDRDPLEVRKEQAVDVVAARRSAARKAVPPPAARTIALSPASRASPASPVAPTMSASSPSALQPALPAPVGPPQAATADELSALDAMGASGAWSVGGQDVNLTNLDKVLFPGPGYTKRDLVRYYASIAPVLLPHLRERPLNFDRWPDGVNGKHFWQKQIPSHAPEWVARWDYPEAGHDQSHTYVVADLVATMAWLANQAVIDLHPWTSRLPDYWRPTYALIDIDPGERTTWAEVLVLARLFRTALGHLGVTAFPKVTGKRGIQAWIPLAPRYGYDETRGWVETLSRAVGAAVPDLVSWEWGKADRGGRARLDYTQNTPIKTLVAPYAVRPVAGAGVSMPISWDELDDPELRPDRWDLRSAIPRVETVGDLFAGALELEQRLPPL